MLFNILDILVLLEYLLYEISNIIYKISLLYKIDILHIILDI